MALLVCRKCGTKFSVGAPFCPMCTAEDAYLEGSEEEVMPRNTVAGASLGVQHPEYDPDGPVPPVVPEGVALDAPIADQIAAVEAAAGTDGPVEVTTEPVVEESTTEEAEAVEPDVDGDGINDVTKAPVKAPRSKR